MIDNTAASHATHNHHSSMLAKVLEYRLLGDIGAELFRRRITFDILRGDVDAHGHDVAIDALGIMRHCQLKTLVTGGKRQDVGINIRLGHTPSGCVIWIIYNPETLSPLGYYWFGGEPGEPLPALGDRVGRHAKANSAGAKNERPMQRLVRRSAFEKLGSIEELVDRLFGKDDERLDIVVSQHLRSAQGTRWRETLASMLSSKREWKDSHELADLIDGYRVIEQAGLGDPLEWWDAHRTQLLNDPAPAKLGPTWVTLFLLHRECRMSGIDLAGRNLERANLLLQKLGKMTNSMSSRQC